MIMNECNCGTRYCKYFRGIRTLADGKEIYYCKAFKFGIPEEISNGNNLHETPIQDQGNNLVYGRGPKPDLVRPFSKIKMKNRYAWGCDNLCSTLRDIYMKTDDPEIKYWCRLGVRMSKNMCLALMTYKKMLEDKGIDLRKHGREEWQLHGEEMYKEINKSIKEND